LTGAVAAGLAGRSLAWRAVTGGGDPASSRAIPVGPKGGALLICGGGRMPEEVRDRFLELAGGPDARIVVIPTAHAGADDPGAESLYLKPWRDLGIGHVTMLHTRSRETADSDDFVKPLSEATGVWIGGGKQGNLASAYADTRVERELKALLDRGGVVAGTSAGAAIMTRVMIEGGRTEPSVGRGFDLLADAIVDQHFLRRKRLDRLTTALTKYPKLLGFGIDEGTALLVRRNHLTVLGESYVVACLPAPGDGAAVSPRLQFLRRGDEADLASLRGPEPHIVSTFDVDAALSTEQ
jgi:cyanophycinase